MDDLEKYIGKRTRNNPRARRKFERGYEEFKIGVMLRMAREDAGITQDAIARTLKTKKSAISRIENHAEDMKLSTIENFVHAVGRELRLRII
jgi:HTH-type transcriptional regulator/antitoxin HipB